MTEDRKRKPPAVLDMPFSEAVARFLSTNPEEVEDAHARVRREQEDVKKRVEETRESIRSGARRTGHRFRL